MSTDLKVTRILADFSKKTSVKRLIAFEKAIPYKLKNRER